MRTASSGKIRSAERTLLILASKEKWRRQLLPSEQWIATWHFLLIFYSWSLACVFAFYLEKPPGLVSRPRTVNESGRSHIQTSADLTLYWQALLGERDGEADRIYAKHVCKEAVGTFKQPTETCWSDSKRMTKSDSIVILAVGKKCWFCFD